MADATSVQEAVSSSSMQQACGTQESAIHVQWTCGIHPWTFGRKVAATNYHTRMPMQPQTHRMYQIYGDPGFKCMERAWIYSHAGRM